MQLLLCLLDEYLEVSEAGVWETGGRSSRRGVRGCGSSYCSGCCGFGRSSTRACIPALADVSEQGSYFDGPGLRKAPQYSIFPRRLLIPAVKTSNNVSMKRALLRTDVLSVKSGYRCTSRGAGVANIDTKIKNLGHNKSTHTI